MQRYDGSRFLAFGVLPAANTIALLLYGLDLATSGSGGAGRSLPVLIVLALVCLLTALLATVKRGRDIGWAAWVTVVLFWVTLGMGPILLVLVGYLAFAKTGAQGDRYGPSPGPATTSTWVWALINLLWPWAVLAVLARLL